jgi:L-2-hydroxyglutarate oxidase LhgO
MWQTRWTVSWWEQVSTPAEAAAAVKVLRDVLVYCCAASGVVGLACARAIAQSGKEVLLLEAASSWGTATSSRHSEVIHAGIYYPTNSLKARLCVEGKHVLYEYCAAKDIPYKRITKMIVATNET